MRLLRSITSLEEGTNSAVLSRQVCHIAQRVLGTGKTGWERLRHASSDLIQCRMAVHRLQDKMSDPAILGESRNVTSRRLVQLSRETNGMPKNVDD